MEFRLLSQVFHLFQVFELLLHYLLENLQRKIICFWKLSSQDSNSYQHFEWVGYVCNAIRLRITMNVWPVLSLLVGGKSLGRLVSVLKQFCMGVLTGSDNENEKHVPLTQSDLTLCKLSSIASQSCHGMTVWPQWLATGWGETGLGVWQSFFKVRKVSLMAGISLSGCWWKRMKA